MDVFKKFYNSSQPMTLPELVHSEEELLQRADDIDLLVIATPDHLHTDTIIRWGTRNISILCEKPVAVSMEQHTRLSTFVESPEFCARVWVAMEYRYIPAIAKLMDLLPTIGDIKMVTIRENRVSTFPLALSHHACVCIATQYMPMSLSIFSFPFSIKLLSGTETETKQAIRWSRNVAISLTFFD